MAGSRSTSRHPLRGLVALLLGLVVLGSLLTFHPGDWVGWGWDASLFHARNAFGFVGAVLAKILLFLLGALALWLLAPAFFLAGGADLLGRSRRPALQLWAAAALLALLWAGSAVAGGPSVVRQGWLGELLSEGLASLAGRTGSVIVLAFLSLMALVFALPGRVFGGLRRGLLVLGRGLLAPLRAGGRALTALGSGLAEALRWVGGSVRGLALRSQDAWAEQAARRAETRARAAGEDPSPMAVPAAAVHAITMEDEPVALAAAATTGAPARESRPEPRSAPAAARRARRKRGDLTLPPLELLEPPTVRSEAADKRFVEERAKVLVDKLASFNIGGRVSAMSQGPVVTTYEFEPDTGVKVNQILSRREDLALALRSKELRMVAPIPGKAAVGVELPNPKPRVIRLREVLEATDPVGAGGQLALALGVDVDGRATWTDLADMPHLLVAGATGTGKSVCINTLLVSLLLAHTPDTLRLFLVDPKMLELSVYNEIPHLMHPVITDNRVALQALNWLVGEMERRYLLLKPVGVRNIGEYNDKVRAGEVTDRDGQRVDETLPFLVGVVEEFADLMMTLGKDIQTPIVRLAQMARAVGIHLVLATQRPSVDIIDGVIKANFPSRIAFKVFSRFDSKTILDGVGAETLIGRGDMLFKHGRQPFPRRVHGAFVETGEVERIVDHWRQVGGDDPAHVNLEPRREGGLDLAAEDDLFPDARRTVILAGFGSTTMLQRRLRVGYTRASRLMDMLEEAGIVGPHTGSKARELLVGPEALEDEELGA